MKSDFKNVLSTEINKNGYRLILVYGRVGAIAGAIILPLFLLKDIYLTQYPYSTVGFRVFPFAMGIIFLITSFLSFKRHLIVMKSMYLVLCFSYMIMICGIMAYNYKPVFPVFHDVLLNALLVIMVLIFIFSYGVRRFYGLVVLLPLLGLFSHFIVIYYKKDFDFGKFMSVLTTAVVLTLLSFLQEHHDRKIIKANLLLRFKEKELLEEVEKTKELKKKIEQESLLDALTGAFNRKAVDQILLKEVSFCRREKQHFMICFFDLDGLKIVNDFYGHHSGDNLLVMFTDQLNAVVRCSDYLFRMGGDEFVLFMKNVELKGFEKLNNRLQRQCVKFNISYSCGFVDGKSMPEASLNEMIEVADQKMYDCKNSKKERSKKLDGSSSFTGFQMNTY